jgi:hypothetical protein
MTPPTNAGPLAVVAAAACLGWAAPAAGEDRGLLDDPFVLSLGTFLLDTSTRVRLNGSTGRPGSEIDLERDTGLTDANRFRVDALWRIGGGRHHVRALYFDMSRRGSGQADREITVGDTTFPVTATLSARFDAKVYELAYEYAFVNRDDFEAAASIGAHALDVGFRIGGNGTVNGRPVQGAAETATARAPLPVLGLRGAWRFADDWYLEAQGQWFGVKFDDVDGRLTDLRAGVTWMFTDHFGVGAGWNRFDLDVDVERSGFDGSLDWRYQGAQLYVTGAF